MKGILFRAPMVKALLNTKINSWPPEPIDPDKPYKYMTRRVIKPTYRKDEAGFQVSTNKATGERWVEKYDEHEMCFDKPRYVRPKYQVGDVCYVKETWLEMPREYLTYGEAKHKYKADSNPDSESLRKDLVRIGYPYKWRPSIHMPESAARIFVEVMAVRAERLQDITEADARAEGFASVADFAVYWDTLVPKEDMATLSFNASPWVFVPSLKRIERPK